MKKFFRYLALWKTLTINSFVVAFTSRFSAGLFLLSKSLRFIFFIVFLSALFLRVRVVENYSFLQTLFFFLTFTLIDTASQLLFREVYRFRRLIVTGDFDLVLVKPMSALFRALAGGADPFDLVMIIPYIILLIVVAFQLGVVSPLSVIFYLALLANGFLIATAFHIMVLALAIVTTEVDHTILIYRDITSMARVPIDIYREPIRGILTYVVPVGIMMTIPAKALFGLLSWPSIVFAFALGAIFFLLSLRFWRYALGKYSSASS
jgi:ABC-2 type transport system permease protein